jgi:hypothetical protein
MTEFQTLRNELREAIAPGREAVVERLLSLLEQQIKRCDRLEKENQLLRKRNEELEGKRPGLGAAAAASNIDYSLTAEELRRKREQRQKALSKKTKKKKAGRKPKENKLESVVRWEDIVPAGMKRRECELQSERIVWRLEQGNAIRVGYRVYRAAWGQTPRVSGVLPRCEYGVEIHVLLAHLVYIIGMSIDKACQVLRFFCQLPLERSQADAMLNQLGSAWETEFDDICEQLALSAVVYTDETSWRVGRLNTSLWSFTSDLVCVMLYGCRKDRNTLESILPPDSFDGTLVSDDAAVYQSGYRSQKCWAHLIRKAIKIMLLNPEQPKYREFLEGLVNLYRDAKHESQDGRLSEQGRRLRESMYVARLCNLCHPLWAAMSENSPVPTTESEKTFQNLIDELMRLVEREQLFQFMLDPNVDPTNNLSERQLRNSALARKANRTNKTDAGAKRQTNIVSVLESLRRSLPTFNMATVVEQVTNSIQQASRIFQTRSPTTTAQT